MIAKKQWHGRRDYYCYCSSPVVGLRCFAEKMNRWLVDEVKTMKPDGAQLKGNKPVIQCVNGLFAAWVPGQGMVWKWKVYEAQSSHIILSNYACAPLVRKQLDDRLVGWQVLAEAEDCGLADECLRRRSMCYISR